MEPLNYLRDATSELLKSWVPNLEKRYPQDSKVCRDILGEMQAASKFVVPKGGRILNDRLRGLPPSLRLPFPSIVIEYESDELSTAEKERPEPFIPATKRIIYARQTDDDMVEAYFFWHLFGPRGGGWSMMPFYALATVGDEEDLAVARANQEELGLRGSESPLIFEVHPTGTLVQDAYGKDWEKPVCLDMMDDLITVGELVEALACSNVSHEALPVRKLNKGAAKRGALPFDEYRVLVVNGRKFDAPGTGSGGSHRSPREHLRRGHIRRLQDGRTVWVNSTIVNAGTAGKISKVYDVRSEVRAA